MTFGVAFAIKVGGACVVAWATGYGFGRFFRAVIRLFYKGAI